MNISEKMENVAGVPKPRLRDLLATEKERQKRSYRRATLFIGLVVLLGAGWLAFSAFNVIKFERRSATLQKTAADLEETSFKLDKEIKSQQTELTATQAQLAQEQQKLLLVQEEIKQGRYQQALQVISNIKQGDPIRAETPGFVDSLTYAGPDKTTISIEVIPDKPQPGSGAWPNTLFTYSLDGRNYFQPPPGNKISFLLDRSIGETRTLVLFVDFKNGEPKGYTVKAIATAGRVRARSFRIVPPSTGASVQHRFVFQIK